MSQKLNPLSGQFDTVLDKAEEIKYDNSVSGLAAAEVQSALDEIQDNIDNLPTPLQYVGTWNANTNTPTLANTDTGKQGFLYQVNVAGTVNFGAGNISFDIGDKVVNNGTIWEKWDHTDAVLSVNGQTGVVSLDSDDVAEGAANLYFTDARAKAASVVDAINDGVTDTAPSQNAVFDALALKADSDLSNLVPTAINEDLVFDKVSPQVRSANTSSVNSEPIGILSGEATDANSGTVTLFSGNADSGATGVSGDINIRTGGGIEGTGSIILETLNNSNDDSSGSITLQTGEVSTGQGSVNILTPVVQLQGNSSSSTAPQLRLHEGTANGSNYAAIKSPDSLAANYTLTLPADDGTNNQLLKTDGSGNLAWVSNIAGNAANVTGTVAVANGGTGQTSLTANNVILGNGTSAVQLVAPGTSGNVLTSDGTTWASTAPAASGPSLKVSLNWVGTPQSVAHDTFVKLTLASPSFTRLTDFTFSSGTFTYTGATTQEFEVGGQYQIDTVSNSNTQRVVGLAAYKNGSQYWFNATQGGVINNALSGQQTGGTVRSFITLATNDTVDFYIFQSNDGGANVDIPAVQVFIALWP
jgi:hypothetical protein